MSRDDDEEPGAEADQDVAVAEPVISLNGSVTALKFFFLTFEILKNHIARQFLELTQISKMRAELYQRRSKER